MREKNCSFILLFKSCSTKFNFIVSDIVPLINVSTKCPFFQKVVLNIWGDFIYTVVGLCNWGFVLFFFVLVTHVLRSNKFSLSCLVFSFEYFLFSVRVCLWYVCVCFNFFDFFILFLLDMGVVLCEPEIMWVWGEQFLVLMGMTVFKTTCFYWIQVSIWIIAQGTFVW